MRLPSAPQGVDRLIFLVGGSKPEDLLLSLLHLRACDGCFLNVNDFNFSREDREGTLEWVLTGVDNSLNGSITAEGVSLVVGLLFG